MIGNVKCSQIIQTLIDVTTDHESAIRQVVRKTDSRSIRDLKRCSINVVYNITMKELKTDSWSGFPMS